MFINLLQRENCCFVKNCIEIRTESFTYDAFGNMLGVRDEFRDAATGGYRFSTKELNARSGLVYFGARYYDPRIGRFITPDPLGDIDGPNLYVY